MHGRFEKKKEKKPLTGGQLALRVVLIVVAVILVLVVAALIAGVVYYNSMVGKLTQVVVPSIDYSQLDAAEQDPDATETIVETEATEAPTTVTTEPPHVASSADYLNILIVGQSARIGETEENYRFADTSILCTINTYEKTLTMTSLLRDSFVKMPDYKGKVGGRIKLATIYHLGSEYGDGAAGSMELMNMTLYTNFGIEVDHNFEIDFDTFVHIIDELGGIEIELTQAESDYLNADDFWVYNDVEPGLQTLDGTTALSYARMRKAQGDGESDINRTSRQRKVMEAVLEKLMTMRPSRIQQLADQLLPMITTSMSTSEITETLLLLIPMLPELEIKGGGVCPANAQGDIVDIYNNGDEHSVLRFNVEETKKYMRAITEGEGVIQTEPTEATVTSEETSE